MFCMDSSLEYSRVNKKSGDEEEPSQKGGLKKRKNAKKDANAADLYYSRTPRAAAAIEQITNLSLICPSVDSFDCTPRECAVPAGGR